MVMPTGTGKSLSMAIFAADAIRQYPQTRIINATHNSILVEQNYKKLLEWWPSAPAGINSAKLKRRDYYRKVTFATIGSVYKDAKVFGHTDLVLVDEAHTVGQKATGMYRQFFSDLQDINPYIKFIGYTATPYRQGQGMLIDDGLFTDYAFDISDLESFNRLIDEGYLKPLLPKRTDLQLDVSDVQISNTGDYNEKQLQIAVDKEEITRRALSETLEVAKDRNHWLIFASGTDHSDHICGILNSIGISSRSVHSKKANAENTESLELFKAGKIKCLVNNNCLTTGFDAPFIDLIVILRPTRSTNLWVQMLGRGTRPWFIDGFDLNTIEGRLSSIFYSGIHNCMVLDFAANVELLGPINDPVLPRKKGDKKGEAPVKICPNCNTYHHVSVRKCQCGYIFPEIVKLKENASETLLIKPTIENIPEYKTFKVDHITFGRHIKQLSKDSLKISYFCGKRVFTEYVCIEHDAGQWARREAEKWWKKRCDLICPVTIEIALQLIDSINHATHIKVHVNKKYPEIIDHCFDGTNFNTENTNNLKPTVEIGSSYSLAMGSLFNKMQPK